MVALICLNILEEPALPLVPRNHKIHCKIPWFGKKSDAARGLACWEGSKAWLRVFPSLSKALDASSFMNLLFSVTSCVSLSVNWAFNLSGMKYDKAKETEKLLQKWKKKKKKEQNHGNQGCIDECFLPFPPLKIFVGWCLTVIDGWMGVSVSNLFSPNCLLPLKCTGMRTGIFHLETLKRNSKCQVQSMVLLSLWNMLKYMWERYFFFWALFIFFLGKLHGLLPPLCISDFG